MSLTVLKKKKLTSFQTIIFGFSGVILLGAFLLMLPCSSGGDAATPPLEALFTATSAVCVTGLVLHDTASYWSDFGQFIIMLLIQIGGMGVVTVAAFFSMLSGRKISLMQRSTMQEAIAAPKVGGIVRLTNFIVKVTLLIEVIGAAVMAPVFCRDFGIRGVWMALFHSVSAFCNAGFDLMGTKETFSSLTAYAADPVVNLTVMALIVAGGIGFLTWDDIRANRLRLHKYRMQSKVILCTTAVLLIAPAVYFYCYEFAGLETGERILSSLFQSVTPRTAGFNTRDLNAVSETGQTVMIALMLIGGSPGSTAGGMKTTTVAVLFAASVSTFLRKEDTHFFGRRIDDDVVRNAATILLMYLVLFFFGGLSISVAEGLPILPCLFETASAVGTVGLSLGLTPQLGTLSRVILIALMFFGRVGGLTLIFAALSGTQKRSARLPQEKITVG
ncbi:MAG: Trk family potassium uptake protein [Lachnospiraceae bacterium]|nr:Trk family potassium uptake protein [Lachnospiraceae bacterium]